mmetsp:Transcript_11751/g.19832  ORF Transcript_11751/g.19832 Transcript_11751/m.19832 type:complete len:311 (-) Transcript_11751:740-1672(-)
MLPVDCVHVALNLLLGVVLADQAPTQVFGHTLLEDARLHEDLDLLFGQLSGVLGVQHVLLHILAQLELLAVLQRVLEEEHGVGAEVEDVEVVEHLGHLVLGHLLAVDQGLLMGVLRVDLELDQAVLQHGELAVVLADADAAEEDVGLGVFATATHLDWEVLERVVNVLGELGVLVQVYEMGGAPVLLLLLLLVLDGLLLVDLLLLSQLLVEVVDFLDLLLCVVEGLDDVVGAPEAQLLDVYGLAAAGSLEQELLELFVLALELPDELVGGALVDRGLVLDLLGSVGVPERGERLLVVHVGGRDGANHDCL